MRQRTPAITRMICYPLSRCCSSSTDDRAAVWVNLIDIARNLSAIEIVGAERLFRKPPSLLKRVDGQQGDTLDEEIKAQLSDLVEAAYKTVTGAGGRIKDASHTVGRLTFTSKKTFLREEQDLVLLEEFKRVEKNSVFFPWHC